MAEKTPRKAAMTDEEEEMRKERKRLETRLSSVQLRRKSKVTYVLVVGASLLSSLLAWYCLPGSEHSRSTTIALPIILGVIACCLFSAYIYFGLEMRESAIRRELIDYEVDSAQSEVSEDVFKNSIQMSYTYLNQYYQQTREHAQRGFMVTVGVAIFGALLICAGIVAMFFGPVSPSYITCASGVITEFIAAVFFYLYNRTVSSMSNYHDKLVLSQNISIALRVAESLPSEDRATAKNAIIRELLKDVNVHLVREEAHSET